VVHATIRKESIMPARQRPILAAVLLATLVAGAPPVLAQQGSGDGNTGSPDTAPAGDASGASGTTGDLNTPQGQRSTSDVEDPMGGTAGPIPGASSQAGLAEPVLALSAARVRQMQERLDAAGFDPGPADGVAGPRTQAALRAFQEARGLDPTGEPDEPTLMELGVE
jgi:peptidoglycan hydrolase-like protein with peptidoglycan-binding domain